MIFGHLACLKFPDICLIGQEKSRKNLTQETYHDRGSNPGSLRDRRTSYRLLHSGGAANYLTKLMKIYLITLLKFQNYLHGLGHKSWQLFYFVDICERNTNVYVSCGMSADIVSTHVVNTLSFRLYMSHFPTELVSSKNKIVAMTFAPTYIFK